MTISQLSNPFSTGGGGDQFEKSVGAFYLVALLAEDMPRGLNRGITKHVKFQQRYNNIIVDDIVVTSETTSGREFKLALQVKHDLTFTKANDLFRRVMGDCWEAFTQNKEWNFGPTTDRLGIAFGTQPPARIEHLQRALDWARTATSADDYFTKLRIPRVASEDMRHYVDGVFRPVLNDVARRILTDEEVFGFLRCLVVMHFDLEHDGARDATYSLNRLLDLLGERDETEARKLASHLFRLVVDCAKDAAGFDYRTLKDKLGDDFRVKERASCQQDLDRLRRHTDLVLDRIITDIGGAVSLPRPQQVNDLHDRINQVGTRAVIIVGEPGTGKSALMKLVAGHLRQESEVIATEVDRLRGPSLESFLEMLQIKQPLDRLLGAISAGSLRCLFIDRLERAHEDEERRRVLEDLIRAVRRYNKQVLADGGHDGSCWRVILTCRKEECQRSVRNTMLAEYGRQHSLQIFEIEDLNEKEFQTIIAQFPRLSYLSKYERISFLLRRPFYLNLLTKREALDEADLPDLLTESWFLKFFWEDIIRQGRPYHEREQVLLRIIQDRLTTGAPFTPASGLNSQALNSLVSDKIVSMEEMGVRLAHDLFEDWAGERWIASEGDRLTSLWERAVRPAKLLRAIELRALYHLEVNHKAEAWLALTSIESTNEVSPSWRDAAIGAIFKSKLLAELLDLAKPLLLAEGAALLHHVLRIMRTVYTKPSSFVRERVAGLPESAEKDRYLSYSREPIVPLWEQVLGFVLKNQDSIPLGALPELSKVCEMWLKTIGTPLRVEVAGLCQSYLVRPFDEPLDDLVYEDDEIVRIYSDVGTISAQTRRVLTLALLSAADCVPNLVEAFVRRHLKLEKRGIVKEILLKDMNWFSIGQHLPEVMLEATEQILCWNPKPREYYERLLAEPGPKSITLHVKSEEEQYREVCCYGRFGIHLGHDWNPIAYDRGPFYFFLRMHTDHGLKLIHRIVNHATDLWRRCQELNEFHPSTPLPQRIELETGLVELWGDEQVYCWSRTALHAPPVECALRALEKWLYEQIENGAAPGKLFAKVLANSTSLSVAGVLVSVSLKYMEECGEALLPILSQPAFWIADTYRVVQYEPMAGMGVMNFASEAQFESIKGWEHASYRKLQIEHIVQHLLMNGTDEAKETLKKAMPSFPDRPPFFFVEEQRSTAIATRRLKWCEYIASWADPATWNFEVVGETEDGLMVSIKPQIPQELQEKYQQDEERLKMIGQKWRINEWGMILRDRGEVSRVFTLEEAIELVDGLPELERALEKYEPTDYLVEGVAAIVSGLIIHKLDWLQKNDLVSWGRQQLLDLVGPTIYLMGVSRSAALAIPTLLRKNPNDKQLRSAAVRLTQHPHYEVRSCLFRSLQILWDSDPDFVWECVAFGISKTKLIRHKGRTETYQLERSFLVRLGLRELDLPKLADHPPRDIDYYGLIPILSVFPFDRDIARFTNLDRFLDFTTDLLKLTIKAHRAKQHRRHSHDSYLSSILLYWDPPFGQALASWMTYLPKEVALGSILDPVLEEWTAASDLLEKVMRSAIDICAEDPTTKQRFAEVWRKVAKVVLASERFEEEILGLLLCTGRFTSKEAAVRLPLDDLLDVFDNWVQTVAHYRAYEILVRFLRNAGFKYMVSHGVRWLAESWERIPDSNVILKDDRMAFSLAHLLHESWYEFGEQLQADHSSFRQFSNIVDHLAAQGNQTAVELQRKLRDLA